MCLSDVIYQQHYPTKKGRGIWSDVCFSGGMGSKPRGLFVPHRVPHFPRVSTPADTDETTGADCMKEEVRTYYKECGTVPPKDSALGRLCVNVIWLRPQQFINKDRESMKGFL